MAILSVTGAIFALIGLGYASRRFGLFDAAAVGVLGRYVVTLALPALVFRALTGRPLGEIVDAAYLAAYLAGSVAVLAGAYLWARRRLGLSAGASTFQAMGASCSNSGFVGYPILAMVMPQIAAPALALNMMVENVVMIPLVLILAERASGVEAGGAALLRRTAGRVARNPITLAILAGLAAAVLPLPLPAILTRVVDLLADSSAAVSLLVIGGTLYGLPLSRLDAAVAATVVGKLVLHPLAVGGALGLLAALGLGTSGRMASAAIVMAAVPAMGIYPILARSYGEGETAAVAMLAQTVASSLTITVLLLALGPND